MNLISNLEKTVSLDTTELEAAWNYLEQAAQNNISEFLKSLSNVLSCASNTPVARMAAGLQLKNALTSKDAEIRLKYQKRWLQFTADVRNFIKQNVLSALGTETLRPSSAAQCVAYIAVAELPRSEWPDLIGMLTQNVTNATSTEMTKEATLEAIGYICQDIDAEVLVLQSNNIWLAVVHSFRKEEPSYHVKLAATNALLNSLELIKTNFDKDYERHFIMQVVCEATQSTGAKVQVAALKCLLKIMSLYYQHMAAYMGPVLFAITMEALKREINEEILHSIECLSRCDEEVDLDIKASNDFDQGRPLASSRFYAKGALQYLVPIIMESLTKRDPIDPRLLLQALGSLLLKASGTNSFQDVPRLARYLDKGGWNTINLWLKYAIDHPDALFLEQMLNLCLLLPMTLDRLKENNTPKYVKSLTKHENNEVKTLAGELVKKWMAVISKSSNEKKINEKKQKKDDSGKKDKVIVNVLPPPKRSVKGTKRPSTEKEVESNENVNIVPEPLVLDQSKKSSVKEKGAKTLVSEIEAKKVESYEDVHPEPLLPVCIKVTPDRPKTVKIYPSKFRSTGLEEEIPLPRNITVNRSFTVDRRAIAVAKSVLKMHSAPPARVNINEVQPETLPEIHENSSSNKDIKLTPVKPRHETGSPRPNQIHSILPHENRSKKKSIQWVEDSNIAEVFYFEKVENERINVNKPQHVEHLETPDLQAIGMSKRQKRDEMEERTTWKRLIRIDTPLPLAVPGSQSTEKEVQRIRQESTLPEFYFTKLAIPYSPREPDFEVFPSQEPKIIPLDKVDMAQSGSSNNNQENSSTNNIDEGLYSRQLYVLDHEAMRRMATAEVLICGAQGLGLEIARNLILGGVKSVTLHDVDNCEIKDIFSQYYLTKADVGKNRAQVTLEYLRGLNSYVTVHAHTENLSEDFLKQFKIIVLTNSPLEEQYSIGELTHTNCMALIVADTKGLFGQVFFDFGEGFSVLALEEEHPLSAMIASITKDKNSVITCLKETKHGFEDGDYVTFSKVHGMVELNGCEPKKVQVFGPCTFSVGDTTDLGDYIRGGVATQVNMPKIFNFKSIKDSIAEPEFMMSDFAKRDRFPQLHLAFQALHMFKQKHKRLPKLWNELDSEDLLSMVKYLNQKNKEPIALNTDLVQLFSFKSADDVCPIQSVIGGITAQEIMKACSGRFHPIFQWLYFDASECPSLGGFMKEGMAQPMPMQEQAQEIGIRPQMILDGFRRAMPNGPLPRAMVTCFNCGRMGHLARFCPTSRSSHINLCHFCGKVGHFYKDCPSVNKRKCYNCQEKGHLARSCSKPRKRSKEGFFFM